MHVCDLKANTIHARCDIEQHGALPSMITVCAIRVYTRQTFIASEGMELLKSTIKDWLFLALVTYVLKVSIGKKPVPVLNYT